MTAAFWILLLLVGLLLFGGALLSFGWWLLWSVLTGLFIGMISRLLVSNSGSVGIGMTIMAGILGSLIGGVIGNVFDWGWIVTFIVSVIISAVFVFGARGSSTSS